MTDTVQHFYWYFGNGLFFKCVISDLLSCLFILAFWWDNSSITEELTHAHSYLEDALSLQLTNDTFKQVIQRKWGKRIVSCLRKCKDFFFFLLHLRCSQRKSPDIVNWLSLLHFPCSFYLNFLWWEVASSVRSDLSPAPLTMCLLMSLSCFSAWSTMRALCNFSAGWNESPPKSASHLCWSREARVVRTRYGRIEGWEITVAVNF